MATSEQVVRLLIEEFVAAWPTGDAARVASLFSDDAIYRNGPMDAVCGRDAIKETLEAFMSMGGEVSVDMLNVVSDNGLTMTERIDYFTLSGKTYSMPVMGVFEIDRGKIVAWRDYFDLGQFTSQLEKSN